MLAVGLALLFALSAIPLTTTGQSESSISTSQQHADTPYLDHAFAALSPTDRVTLGYLLAESGGNLSIPTLEKVIQTALLPLNVREVLLDIGWENFSAGNPPYQRWVDDWLTACDLMGIRNVLYVGQLTSAGFNSQWVNSLVAKDPAAATYYFNGTRAAFVSPDSPGVARYLERDLGILYSYYGSHVSWVGLGTGSAQNGPYYSEGGSLPPIGYSNVSISNFANSRYFTANVNSTGYLPNGELDALRSERVQQGIVLSSGLWMTSTSYEVFGSGSNSNFVEMRFEVPSSISTLQILWYGCEVGTPGNLQVAVFGDKGGRLNADREMATSNASATFFTSTPGWQEGVQVSGNFTAGWYWVKFTSPSSSNTNHYSFYMKDYVVNNATAKAAQPVVGPGIQSGSTILWLKDPRGSTVAIYPYQEAYVGAPTQFFSVIHSFSFNTVFLFLSDRPYDAANATVTVTDVTDDNKVLATGLLSQALDQGLENWVPIALNNTVTTSDNHEYMLSIQDPSHTWVPIMRYVVTDPSQAGFQDQSRTLLFELGNLVWTQGFKGLGRLTSNGNDAVKTGKMDAVRFSPGSNETLQSLQVLMHTTLAATSANYTSGSISVAVWRSNANGTAPKGPPLQELTVQGTDIPRDGFFNVSGFNLPLVSGREYWIVFTANSTEGFTFARLTSPFEFLVQVSSDGGNSWSDPSEGPTEFAFTLTFSNGTIGTYVGNQTQTVLTPGSILAQPFVASSGDVVDGVYIGPLSPGPPLIISIVPTNADGKPAVSPLASGFFNAGNITLGYGPEFVQFSSVAKLNQGDQYWITIQPTRENYEFTTLQYLASYPDLPIRTSAAVSKDGGLTWKNVTNNTDTIATIPEYLIATGATPTPRYDFQEIVHDLATYHTFPVSTGPLRGWKAYTQASELEMFSNVAEWMSNFTGKVTKFYANVNANILIQLNLKGISPSALLNSNSTCNEFLSEVKQSVALSTNQFAYVSLSALQNCGSHGVLALGRQLNFSPYLGKNFGLGTANDVLVVGDQSVSNISSYLSNAFNTTYVDFTIDPTLGPGQLSSFKAILWLAPNAETIPSATSNLLSEYVQEGGVLISSDASFASQGSLRDLTSAPYSPSGDMGGPTFLKGALEHTNFANDTYQVVASNTTLFARSANLTISATALGAGKLVSVGFENSTFIRTDDQLVVVSNLLSLAAHTSPPFWYHPSGSEISSGNEYSVQGTGGHLLVWAYNPSGSGSVFSLHLNGSYYGVSPLWKTVELPGFNVTSGYGSDVRIQTTIPSRGLAELLIVPASEPLISYSTGSARSQYAYPNQGLYTIAAGYNQSVVTMISTGDSANQVLLNEFSSIPKTGSMAQFINGSAAWYFSAGSDSLFVKFQSTGLDSIRFLFYSAHSLPAVVLPERSLAALFVAALIAETVSLFLLLSRTKRRSL